jgi:hypothetical protein
MEKRYIICESELLSLLECSRQLGALEGAGVDNWEGYDECNEYMEEEVLAEDLEEMYQLYASL